MKKRHLLILHNGSKADGADHIATRFSQMGLDTTICWSAGNRFPADLGRFDGALLTGSGHGAYEAIGWIEREHELILEMAAAKLPMLGLCFGSQILASALCGRDQLFRRESCEVGFLSLPLSEAGRADRLLADLDKEVEMLVWHNDEVRADHADMVILASSPDCPNQIWRYQDRPIWGIQGHPELDRAKAIELIETEQTIFEADGADVDQLKAAAHDAAAAKTIFERFALVIGRS